MVKHTICTHFPEQNILMQIINQSYLPRRLNLLSKRNILVLVMMEKWRKYNVNTKARLNTGLNPMNGSDLSRSPQICDFSYEM